MKVPEWFWNALAGALAGWFFSIALSPEYILSKIRLYSSVEHRTYVLPLSKKFDEISKNFDLKLIIVRYGADETILNGTAAEKIDGSLQNITENASIEYTEKGGCLRFNLPVHSPLGTQFKLYAVPKSPVNLDNIMSDLKDCSEDKECMPHIGEISRGAAPEQHAYFLLTDKNIHIWAVRTHVQRENTLESLPDALREEPISNNWAEPRGEYPHNPC